MTDPLRLARFGVRSLRLVAAGVALLGGMLAASAAPRGERVVRGQVEVIPGARTTTIRASNNSIIEFGNFDIGRTETVRFIQPDSRSRVFNRVSGSPTLIEGRLIANGSVYLVNPAGIYFGKQAIINTGRLYAAAGSLSDEDFLAGRDRFSALGGAIRNDGVITSQAVHLVGSEVANSGSIIAPRGIVTMSAGGSAYIGESDSAASGAMYVRIQSPAAMGKSSGPAVTNAPRGAGDVFSLAIRNRGKVKAKDIQINAGAAGVQISGSLDASNASGPGGRISITGGGVLLSGAAVDASGTTGGGVIRVGGDWQGGPALSPALFTAIDSATQLRADASLRGDGGQVVVWAQNQTTFAGNITARGGPLGGNGGRAEVSGKKALTFLGTTSLEAGLVGAAGQLLLDPDSITIVPGPLGSGDDAALLQDHIIRFQEGTNYRFSADALSSLTGNVVLQARRDIQVLPSSLPALLDMTSARSVTMQAGELINLNGATLRVSGPLTLEVGSYLASKGNPGALLTLGPVAFVTQHAAAPPPSDGGTFNLVAGHITLEDTFNLNGTRVNLARATQEGDRILINNGTAKIGGKTVDSFIDVESLSHFKNGTIAIGAAKSAGASGRRSLNVSTSRIDVFQDIELQGNGTTLRLTSDGDLHVMGISVDEGIRLDRGPKGKIELKPSLLEPNRISGNTPPPPARGDLIQGQTAVLRTKHGDILLAPQTSKPSRVDTATPDAATIFSTPDDTSVAIFAGGNFRMGHREKLSCFGVAYINAAKDLYLSDISALSRIILFAGQQTGTVPDTATIFLQSRPAGPVRGTGTQLGTDVGMDIVSGREIQVAASQIVEFNRQATDLRTSFASLSLLQISNAEHSIPHNVLIRVPPDSLNLLGKNGLVLDLAAELHFNSDIGTTLAAVAPRALPPAFLTERAQAVDPSVLGQLSIFLLEPDSDDKQAGRPSVFSNFSVFDDLTHTKGEQLPASRLDTSELTLFSKRLAPLKENLRKDLGVALRASGSGAVMTAREFADYLKRPEHKALRHRTLMAADIYGKIDRLGLPWIGSSDPDRTPPPGSIEAVRRAFVVSYSPEGSDWGSQFWDEMYRETLRP